MIEIEYIRGEFKEGVIFSMFSDIDYTAISNQLNVWSRQKEMSEISTFSSFKCLCNNTFYFNLGN